MKNIFAISLFVFTLFFCKSVNAQAINSSIEDAFKKAKKENKIVMMVVESTSCNECNEVAAKGISSNLVKRNIENNCILVHVKKMPEEFSNPNTLYIISSDFFGVIFSDEDKNILDIMSGSSTNYIPYLEHIEKALKEKQSSDGNISQLKKDYYNNVGSFDVIKKLIEKIRKLNLEPKEQLLDELTQKAPEDSAASLSFLKFILQCAPLDGSVAMHYTQKNIDNYNMAWYSMPLSERVAINNRIYSKSLLKAVADKDLNYAYTVARAKQNTFTGSPNLELGQQANQETMLQYYKGVHDTANYLRNVSIFYERFYMSAKVEVMQKEDSVRKEKLFKSVPLNPNSLSTDSLRTRTVMFSPRTQYFASQLNNGAWTVYTYTKDINYLTKALSWAKRGIEFFETPAIMDTYARLLYKTGNIEEAVLWEQKAIDGNKKKNFSTTEYDKVLSKMKSNSERIDEY